MLGDFDLRQVASSDIYWDEVVSIEATGEHQGTPYIVLEFLNGKPLTHLTEKATLSGAQPSDVAGRPAYTVRITPRSLRLRSSTRRPPCEPAVI